MPHEHPDTIICGIDEVGRGPLAGPVFAAAVILAPHFDVSVLKDSKVLSEKKRIGIAQDIFATCLWGIGAASVSEIDTYNILQASLLAMERAYTSLLKKISHSNIDPARIFSLVDGNKEPNIPHCKAYIKADATFPEVMAASILAKVSRDKLMCQYAKRFPQYGYEKHKGYCTKQHLHAIYTLGESPIQRKTFSYPKQKPHTTS